MTRRIDIRFREKIAEDDVHKVRNFIEDVWASAWRQGWARLEDLDDRVTSMADFGFTFRARESHEATDLVDRLVKKHYMATLVDVIHSKKATADG
jgi:hypothetical protein